MGFVLPPVASVTTAAPTALDPQEQYGPDVWVYAAAPFSVQLPPTAVSAGDDVVVQNSDFGTVVPNNSLEHATAIACNQTTWKTFLWNTATTGDATVKQTATKLTFDLGTDPTDDPSATYFTDCVAIGDFDARSHYKLTTWPARNSVRVGLLVNNPTYPSPAGSLSVQRASLTTGESYVLDATDPGGGVVTQATSETSGDLRVKQQGDTIRALYRDASTGNKWNTLDTSPAYTGAVSLGVSVWGEIDVIPSDVQVKLTKFKLTRGLCV
jgi:hypothetical protein